MKVVFLKHVDRVGKAGEIKEVTNGYFRNFLLPRGLAKAVTPETMKEVESLREHAKVQAAKAMQESEATIAALKNEVCTISKKANEEGQLFGSVSAHDIAELLHKKGYAGVTDHQVHIETPIKTLGEHQIALRLGHGVEGVLTITVEKGDE